MTFTYSHTDNSTEIKLSKITKNFIYESRLFTLISSFLRLYHYIIHVKNDVIVQLQCKVGGLFLHICTIIIGILKIVPKDLKKKYFCRSFRNLISPNFDFVPTGNKLHVKYILQGVLYILL